MDYPARVKYCVEELRHSASVATGGGLVVLGVLAVVWLSGLEPLARDLKQLDVSLSSLNRDQQVTERELLAVPRQAFMLALEQQRLDAQRQTFITLPRILERALLKARTPGERDEVASAFDRLAKSQAEFPKAEAALAGKVRSFERDKSLLEATRKRLHDRRGTLAVERQKLRERGTTISFAVVGQKLDLARAYAAIAWSAIFWSLVITANMVRVSLFRSAREAISGLIEAGFTSAGDVSRILNRIPTWAYPLPARLSGSRGTEGNKADLQKADPSASGFDAIAVTLLCGLCLIHLRVMFVALAISGVSGSQSQRVAAAVSTLVAAAGTLVILWAWCFSVDMADSVDVADSHRNRSSLFWAIAIVLACACLAMTIAVSSAGAARWLVPAASVSLYIAGSVVMVVVGVAIWRCVFADGRALARPNPDVPRRVFVACGAALLISVVSHFLNASSSERRRPKQSRSLLDPLALPLGFYERLPSHSDPRGKPARRIVHFLDADGRFKCGARILKGRLKRVQLSHSVQDPGVRIHAECCNVPIETYLLEQLSSVRPRRRPLPAGEETLRMMLELVRRDLEIKARTGSGPSLRLSDLVAAGARRLRQPSIHYELERLLESSGRKELFEFRRQRWNDEQSTWRGRWENSRNRVRWGGRMGGVF